jgi:AcrR family transcriptional regulator
LAARKAVVQELTRERILEIARELFVTHGYRNVSMRQIARKLGYSHGALYYHFENKAELFYALVSDDFALLDRKLEEVLEQTHVQPHEKLEQILLGFIEFGLTHQSHYEIMFLIKDEEVRNYVQQEPNASYDKFAHAIYVLSGKQVNPAMVWSLFLALHGFVSHYCKSGQTFADMEMLAKSYVKFLLKGLA